MERKEKTLFGWMKIRTYRATVLPQFLVGKILKTSVASVIILIHLFHSSIYTFFVG